MNGWASGRRLAVLAVAGTIAVAGMLASGVQAATVRVGSPFTDNFVPTPISGTLTIAQRTMPEAGASFVSPVDGTVTSYQLIESRGTFAIQVLRFDGAAAQSVASSSPSGITETASPSPPIFANVPIKAGEVIAIKNSNDGDLLGAATNGSTYSVWSPPLADGGPGRPPEQTSGPYELGLAATVRYCVVPKLKGKSSKAARAALRHADCTIGKVKKSKVVRKKKTVLKQSVAPGTSISDTAPVNLKISRRR